MDLKLKNKKIVVTGGANGIGRSIVVRLLQEGAIPIVVDKDKDGLTDLKKTYAGQRQLQTFLCDLTDPLEVAKLITQLNATSNGIYGLVNNAGVNDGVGITGDVSQFIASLYKNLVHYFQMTRGLAEKIKKSQGSIVNISSKVSVTGQGGTSGYAAAKGAINALTREWAVELAPFNVDVNCVIPAEVKTPQYEQWIKTGNAEAKLPRILQKINLGQRLTRPEEIADYVVFLLSRKSSHTTGQLIFVDGGYTHLDDTSVRTAD